MITVILTIIGWETGRWVYRQWQWVKCPCCDLKARCNRRNVAHRVIRDHLMEKHPHYNT